MESKSKYVKMAIVIGAAGVGKTTTIMKRIAEILTASKKENTKPHPKIKVITTDTVKVGAMEQLAAWSKILSFDFEKVENAKELESAVNNSNGYTYIFIDTPPCNPNNEKDILRLSELLCGFSIGAHLLISASFSEDDIKNIIEKFRTMLFSGVILTKCDESGNFEMAQKTITESGEEINFLTSSINIADGIQKLKDGFDFENVRIFK